MLSHLVVHIPQELIQIALNVLAEITFSSLQRSEMFKATRVRETALQRRAM